MLSPELSVKPVVRNVAALACRTRVPFLLMSRLLPSIALLLRRFLPPVIHLLARLFFISLLLLLVRLGFLLPGRLHLVLPCGGLAGLLAFRLFLPGRLHLILFRGGFPGLLALWLFLPWWFLFLWFFVLCVQHRRTRNQDRENR